MSWHARVLALLAALALSGPAPLRAQAADDFARLLAHADAIRSGDADAFAQAMAELDRRRGEATPAQAEQLAYLAAYQRSRAGDFAAAIAQLQQLSESAQGLDVRFRAATFLVNNYAITREFSEGLRVLDAMLPLLPQIRSPELREQGLVTAAIMYNQVGQYQLGLDYAARASAESGSGRTRCIADTLRLEAQQELGEAPASRSAYEDAIGRCRAHGERIVAGFATGHLARRLAADGEAARAIALLQSSLPEVRATRYPRLVGEIHALLAVQLLATGDLAGAEAHARTAISEGDDALYTLPTVTAHRTLYEIAERRGDAERALAHHRRYAEADKAYLDNIKARELAFQMVRHETAQKNQTIELLNQRNAVLQLQQRVTDQAAANNRLLIAFLVLVLASIAFWAYKVKRLQLDFRRLAETDALTGISNRLHFTGEAGRKLAQAARDGRPGALVMFDLDHFKAINDRHGHGAGDWVLRQCAEACRRLVRREDGFGRLGGEEFALLLLPSDPAGAVELAERCRQVIAGLDTAPTGSRFQVTASFGIAGTGTAGHRLDALLAQADQALYRAKAAGRNRSVVYVTPDEPAAAARRADEPARSPALMQPSPG